MPDTRRSEVSIPEAICFGWVALARDVRCSTVRCVSSSRWVDISYTKWPDHPHYAYRMRVLGEDNHGVWGACEAGESVYKSGELAFIRESTLLSLVPRDGCWSALWYPPSEPVLEVYVDINSCPEWTVGAVEMIDLDFDVIRRRDGTVQLVDEDEFEEHRLTFGYPNDLVALARSAAKEVTERASHPTEPFASSWRTWYSECFR